MTSVIPPQRIRRALLTIFFGVAFAAAQSQFLPMQAQPAAQLHDTPEAAPAKELLASREAQLRSDLAAHPDSASVLYQLGLVLRQENKPKESLEIYTRAAVVQKPDAGQLRSVALNYVLLNDLTDAIHWLQVAETQEPANVDVLYSLARCYYSSNQFHQAEEVYLRLLKIKPDHLKAEENLGLTFDAENEPEKAEDALRTATGWAAKESTDEWPSLDLGAFLLDHDRAEEAVPFLRKAKSIAPNCATCHEKLGRALEQSGEVTEGVAELEIAVHLDPKNPNTHFELGHAYRQAGALDKARAEFALSEQLRRERDHP